MIRKFLNKKKIYHSKKIILFHGAKPVLGADLKLNILLSRIFNLILAETIRYIWLLILRSEWQQLRLNARAKVPNLDNFLSFYLVLAKPLLFYQDF